MEKNTSIDIDIPEICPSYRRTVIVTDTAPHHHLSDYFPRYYILLLNNKSNRLIEQMIQYYLQGKHIVCVYTSDFDKHGSRNCITS